MPVTRGDEVQHRLARPQVLAAKQPVPAHADSDKLRLQKRGAPVTARSAGVQRGSKQNPTECGGAAPDALPHRCADRRVEGGGHMQHQQPQEEGQAGEVGGRER
jgi:hypothetical protein